MDLVTPYTLGIYFSTQNKELEDFKEYFASKFLGQNFPPHLSVLALPIPEENVQFARKDIKEVLLRIKPFQIVCKQLIIDPVTYYSSISVSEEVLYSIHINLFEAFSPLRKGYIREKDMKISENEFVKKYGFKYSGENYYAHFTLGKIPDDKHNEISVIKDRFALLKGKSIEISTINAGVFLDRDVEKRSVWEDSFELEG